MRSRAQKGFTLIELVITVAIILIMAAIVVVVGYALVQRARINRTFADLKAINTALGFYQTERGFFPNAAGLRKTLVEIQLAPDYQGSPNDAWGTPFGYSAAADLGDYCLCSGGTDRAIDGRCNDIFKLDALRMTALGCDICVMGGGDFYGKCKPTVAPK